MVYPVSANLVHMRQLLLLLACCSICSVAIRNAIFKTKQRSKFTLMSTPRKEITEPTLKQLQIRFSCDDIDSDELSELMLEVGTLSVSVEVESMKDDVFNDETKWGDLQKQKSWETALLRSNFPSTYDYEALISVVRESFPDKNLEFEVVDVESRDWITHVQVSC